MTEPVPINNDEELARLAQAGSLPAFEELVSRFEGRLFRFLVQGTQNENDAADLVQETLVAAYQNLARFECSRSFATWVFTIARRKQIDHFRARGRAAARAVVVTEPIDEDDPGRLVERVEESVRVWNIARAVLGESQFQALWLKYREDLSVEEIARVLGLTRVHVKVILFRARARLVEVLERNEQPKRTVHPNASGAPKTHVFSQNLTS